MSQIKEILRPIVTSSDGPDDKLRIVATGLDGKIDITFFPDEIVGGPGSGIDDLSIDSRVNGSGSTVTRGMAVSLTAAGTFVLASNDDDDLVRRFYGIVYDTSIISGGSGRILMEGTMHDLTNGQMDAMIFEGNPFIYGRKYYLGLAGQITVTAPSVGWVKTIGFGASTDVFDLRFGTPLKL